MMGVLGKVLELTDNLGADVIYDPVGGDVFIESLRCIAPEGRIMPVGFAAGSIQQIPANILLVKNITVTGLNLGYYFGWSPVDMRVHFSEQMKNSMAELFHWYVNGLIKPRISHCFPITISRSDGNCTFSQSSEESLLLWTKKQSV